MCGVHGICYVYIAVYFSNNQNRHFGGVVNAMPCYLHHVEVRHFLRERVFESLRCRIFCIFFAFILGI
jgi:hypothetical protein